ncbi:MAG TPA: hypothetical protein V6D18_15895 [Thermosynechococcaceae cyanobacterium]
MSGFFNFLKNLFSSLFSFLRPGSKKIEASSKNVEVSPKKIEASPKKPKPAKRSSGYFLELDQAQGVGSTPAKPAEEPAISPQTAQPAVAVTQLSAEAKPAKVEAPAPTKAEAKPDPAAVAQALNLPQPTVTNFATTYMNTGNGAGGRRRPGANMSSYLDMAKQMRTSD